MNSQFGCAMMASMMLGAAAHGQLVIDLAADASPWLAGHTDGTTIGTRGVLDEAPEQRPPTFDVSGLERLLFSASGETKNTPNNPFVGPDGSSAINPVMTEIDDLMGFSNVVAPMSAVIAIFTADGVTPAGAPTLDFSSPASRDFTELAPELHQVFFVGDGLAAGGAEQQFVVPDGATTLHIGLMDRFGWSNNEGRLDVTVTPFVVPTPGSALLALLAAGSVGMRRRRVR